LKLRQTGHLHHIRKAKAVKPSLIYYQLEFGGEINGKEIIRNDLGRICEEDIMKQLIVIIGPNGVGKTTTAKKIVEQYENVAYVDSDWCRVMNPFAFSESTKETIMENIYCLLRNYLSCSDVNKVIFTYAWHGERKEIYERVIEKLKNDHIEFKQTIIILKCSRDENIERAIKDGRDEIRIKRGMEMTFSFYDNFDYPCIDTTNMTPLTVAQQIVNLIDTNLPNT